MRLAILFFCTVLLLSGCNKRAQQSSVAPADSGAGANGTAEGKSQARAYLEKGKLLYQDDDDSGAAEAFEQAIQLDPNLAEAHFRLGLAYEALARSDDAEAAYKKAIGGYKKYLEDNPDDA